MNSKMKEDLDCVDKACKAYTRGYDYGVKSYQKENAILKRALIIASVDSEGEYIQDYFDDYINLAKKELEAKDNDENKEEL